MGSDSWWSGEDFSSGFSRQMTLKKEAVPAGVEEVRNKPLTTFLDFWRLQSATKTIEFSPRCWELPPFFFFQVTAIALLQHLHGSDRARAVLLQLPDHLTEQMSWSANWGKVGFLA